jgi:cyclopropane-fatty-acyl-phospholipid synthase
MHVKDPYFFRALTFGGHIGAAESYVRGEWTTSDLPSVMRLFAANREALDGLEKGWARLSQPFLALLRVWNRNTRSGSARNISAHYDLGNEFFELFLDDTMTYSCGIFPDEEASMREASIHKYDRLCQKLELSNEDHLLEIGTGWGGFAVHAASTYGCRVTTTTISREQHRLATERVAAAGLSDRVTVLLRDYRDLEGEYDKLVSIEMIEAVGHQFLEEYFQKCAELLAPHGRAAIQAITVRDDWYDPKQRQVDFIKRYIFPGSFIPSVTALSSAAGTTDMRIIHFEDQTPHYAETLRRWRREFMTNWPRINQLGFDEQFRRLWDFYFCYCEGGFDEAILGCTQIVWAKPANKGVIDTRQHDRIEVVA